MTFAQRRNRLTTHFSEPIPIVKRRMTVFGILLLFLLFTRRIKFDLYLLSSHRLFLLPYLRNCFKFLYNQIPHNRCNLLIHTLRAIRLLSLTDKPTNWLQCEVPTFLSVTESRFLPINNYFQISVLLILSSCDEI